MRSAMSTVAFSAWMLFMGALIALTACTITLHQRDERTIEAVRTTIATREADVGRAVASLAAAATMTARPEDGAWLAQEARDLKAIHEAERVRLGSWSYYESQKSDAKP